MTDLPSLAEMSLALTGIYESELLVELMLRYWKHPFAEDAGFREDLLETAAGILRDAVDGHQQFPNIRPQDVGLVLAIYKAEPATASTRGNLTAADIQTREDWSKAIRQALPSCFCDPELLP